MTSGIFSRLSSNRQTSLECQSTRLNSNGHVPVHEDSLPEVQQVRPPVMSKQE